MAEYRVLCASLLSNTISEELAVHDLEYSEVLNAPGAMSGWVSLDDAKVTRATLDPGSTAIYIERGGLLVWGGILWTAVPDTNKRELALGAEGFWSYFRRRLIRVTQTFAAVDQLAIAQALIDYAQDAPGGDLGIVVGSETSGMDRDRTYLAADRKNLGAAVEELAAVEGGFDFQVAVAWDGSTPERTFALHYPRRGSRIDGLVWNHNIAGVASITVDVDAKSMSNQIDTLGAGDGDTMLIASAADTSLLARYPLMEDALAYRDVVIPETLQGHAAAQVGRRARPPELPKVTTLADTFPGLGSFQVGDEGRVVVDDGWLEIDAFHRVQAIEVDVPDTGPEMITTTFVSADAQVF